MNQERKTVTLTLDRWGDVIDCIQYRRDALEAKAKEHADSCHHADGAAARGLTRLKWELNGKVYPESETPAAIQELEDAGETAEGET